MRPAAMRMSVAAPEPEQITQLAGHEALQALAVTPPLRAIGSESLGRHRRAYQAAVQDRDPHTFASGAWDQRFRLLLIATNGMNAFAIGLLIQVILVKYARMSHVPSYIVQAIASVQINFLLSRYLTWLDRNATFLNSLTRFNVQQIVITGLGMAGYAVLEQFDVNYIMANVAVTAVLTPISLLSSRKWSMSERIHLRRRLTSQAWPVLAILVIQSALSLRLVWSNTAFQDEALYLWAGHLELAHLIQDTPVSAFQTSFSGAPVIYPPLGALADSIGGLAAARIMSLTFMLGATVLLYFTCRRLLGYHAAIAAAALFAVFGAASQLGAFATYDAMALFLTALAAWLVVHDGGRFSELLLVVAGVVLALADATKYASALWNPVVIILAVLTASASTLRRRLMRGVRLIAYVAVPVILAIHEAGATYLHGIVWTTLNRQIVTQTPPIKVLDIAWGWLALLFLLGIIGIWIAWYDHGRPWGMPVLMLVAALLAPIEQARISDVTSLHKHVVFGSWFLCMIAGYTVSRIAYLDGRLKHGAIISSVLVGVFAMTGYTQASSFMASWPSLRATLPALDRAVTTDHCPCLIFQEEAAHYYLPTKDLAAGLIGPYSFTYASVQSQEMLSGVPAMAAAVGNGYFNIVEIDASRGSTTYRTLIEALSHSGQYALISSTPWALNPGEPTEVWVRDGGGAW
jgi:putative flippase GtrA